MKLQEIDKASYRKNLNIVIAVFVGSFAVLSVGLGSLLIALFAEPIVDPETQSNFRFNVLGVVTALIIMSLVMNSFKKHPFMTDIYYVWQLKQIHNRIYRKLVKIKKAAEQERNNTALTVLAFYYKSLEQVYQLDNNTLTISTVKKDIEKIKGLLGDKDFDQEVEKFDQSMIASI